MHLRTYVAIGVPFVRGVAEGTRKMESIHDHNAGDKDITTLVFHFLEYKRSPEAFLVALRGNPILFANCALIGDRAKLIASLQDRTAIHKYLKTPSVVWPDGTSLMNPGQLEQLKPRHVICTEDFRQCVCQTVSEAKGACSEGMKLKRRKWIAIPSQSVTAGL